MADNLLSSLEASTETCTLVHDWRFHRITELPSQFESAAQKILVNSKMLTPLDNRHGKSVVSEQPLCRTISSLLLPCSPAAIGRLVISIVVYAFKCIRLRRTTPQVANKVFKHIPSFTDRDSTPAVSTVVGCVLVKAPASHCLPRLVRERWSFIARRVAMLLWATLDALLTFSGAKIAAFHCRTVTAVALTLPKRLTLDIKHGSTPDNKPLSKSMSSQIDKTCHSYHPFMVDNIVYQVSS
jgi:hypothetical protein